MAAPTEIRAVVADDEPLARRGIRQLAAAHDDLRIIGEAKDGRDAVQVVRMLKPDLLFLDVQMPELDGFDVLVHEVTPHPLVVFVTAYEDFALRAFEVDAADYLLKPVSSTRFATCLERVRARLGTDRRAPAAAPSRTVVAHTRAGDVIFQPEEIDWIEAQDYYAEVHVGRRCFLVRESLKSLEARLPEHLFARAHRSALVNLARVRSLVPTDSGGGELILMGGARVPLSRRSRRSVQDRIRGRR